MYFGVRLKPWVCVCIVRACRSCASRSGPHRLSRVFSSARCPSLDDLSLLSLPDPLYSGPPQSSPSLPQGRPTAFLTAESSTTVGRVYRVGSDPLSSLYVGGLPSVCLSVSSPSLSDPPLTRTPRSCVGSGSHLACLHRDTHREQQSFSSALTRLLAMSGSLPHRSHAHLTTRYPRHATANLSLSISYRLEQPI